MIRELKNLNALCRHSKQGLYKLWVLQDKNNKSKIPDFMQKISFSIQDLNNERTLLKKPSLKSIVYVIVLVTWIQEAYLEIEKSYRKEIIEDFSYEKKDDLYDADKYIKAVRSFAVAHPLSTDRHERYGFDGNYICVDIRSFLNDMTSPFIKPDQVSELNYNGIEDNGNNNCNFYFYAYSKKQDNMKFYHYIGCNFQDIYHVAELYIDKLYALDKYLKNLKINDYR